MKTQVVRRNAPHDVYIGRPSKFGNPFVIGKHGDRDEVIRKYREWFYSNPELMRACVRELKGKRIACYCAPLPCHGDILAEYADSHET